ncbi:MAG: protein-L-isoaspartate(D-aspartate) O-methyltransferase [Myxococcota bacterium]
MSALLLLQTVAVPALASTGHLAAGLVSGNGYTLSEPTWDGPRASQVGCVGLTGWWITGGHDYAGPRGEVMRTSDDLRWGAKGSVCPTAAGGWIGAAGISYGQQYGGTLYATPTITAGIAGFAARGPSSPTPRRPTPRSRRTSSRRSRWGWSCRRASRSSLGPYLMLAPSVVRVARGRCRRACSRATWASSSPCWPAARGRRGPGAAGELEPSARSDREAERHELVESTIVRRGVSDEAVLAAMRAVPRHAFVPEHLANQAYTDMPLPIGDGQTISQPYIVAKMIELARIGPSSRVLDVGTGSGYQAAVLAQLGADVYSIERLATRFEAARRVLEGLHLPVTLRCGDGKEGWPEAAPFDAILVAAASPEMPDAWTNQLALGGRLVMPIGTEDLQELVVLERTPWDTLRRTTHGEVAFVPLR